MAALVAERARNESLVAMLERSPGWREQWDEYVAERALSDALAEALEAADRGARGTIESENAANALAAYRSARAGLT